MYKQLYFFMFNRITDAAEMIKEGRYNDALLTLVNTQKEAEQMFIDCSEREEYIRKKLRQIMSAGVFLIL